MAKAAPCTGAASLENMDLSSVFYHKGAGNAMTNEELVALIQGGDREKLAALWEQVERFVALQARRRVLFSGGLGGVEVDDLYQSGYIALVAAADSYDPAAGCSFIGWLTLHLKKVFAEAGGYRSRRQARDPLHRAGSLDAPVRVGDEEADALGDFIPDPGAVQDFQDAEERLYLEQLHNALEKALDELPDWQGDAIRRHFYQNWSLEEIAATEGISGEAVRQRQEKGLRVLRQQRELQQFVEDRTPYYLRVGVSEFQRTGESAVERIVFRRERLTELRAERPKLDRVRLEAQAASVSEDYINAIDDPFVRTFFRLRFLRGLCWKDVASAVGGGRTWTAVRDACLRYLNAHPETPHAG